MVYKYRNLKTKEVITTTNKVSGKNWALVDDAQEQAPVDDAQEQAPVDEISEEAPSEKAPAKPSKKGKK